VVPVVLVVQELPVDPCFRFQARIKIIYYTNARGRRQLAGVALAVHTFGIHFVGMVQGRRERGNARVVPISDLGTEPLIRKDVIRIRM